MSPYFSSRLVKGSTVGRETTDADKLDGKVQKDMDFIAVRSVAKFTLQG
jgi:hypothetical protein